MPLYQMLCISAHYPEYKHIKQLVTQTCTHLMTSGGVVRKIDSWGTRVLPQRMKRHKQIHSLGDYWTLHFDASPRTIQSLNKIMRQDPLVVRWTVLKLGSKVEDIAAKGRTAIEGDEHLNAALELGDR
ncbi:37s ribosomal protein mrp17 [Moniliophthora roreri MCA 2997]|uniref:37s ribosomal protein mrp17 n=2 Tax=Moniliophthora roreri TaxID=221103 RepID=V2XWD5_MONRO|nr:37s ribosomal protein mrp17 [Moniliophthora roreri MCA 2997]KAI3618742.1 37s ribosomal protein mrp17 [Moniliophthora roreri]